jgi:hypothetical protein
MARGKHSVALFEVIQSGKQSKPRLNLRAPNWWCIFKREKTPASAPTSTPPPAAVESLESVASQQPVVDVKLDPDHQRITFHLSYTSAIIAGFAVLVVVGLAYIVGEHIRGGLPRTLTGPSTADLLKGPAHPNVLDVKPTPTKTTAPLLEADDAITAAPVEKVSLTAPAPTTEPAKRMINRNYVIVQSYPDAKSAQDACDVLAKNDIPCTVENSLANFASGWYSVVTLSGFDHIRNNPDFEQTMDSIRAVSAKFAGTAKFKKFEPQPYKWKG